MGSCFFGVSWYDYGRRMYDPALGRFHVQDRFAEKYLDFSPYQYAANNPIGNIDINGDSIWATVTTTVTNANGTSSIQNNRYYYGQDANGNYGFLDASGALYSGNDAFIGQLTAALGDLSSKPVGKSLVDDLMNSTNNTEIVKRARNTADGQSGSYITWNPTSTRGAPDNAGTNTRQPFIGLGHEMAHVQDIWNGTMNRNTWVTYPKPGGGTGTIPNSEIYATHMENRIRSEHGVPLRVSYAMGPGGRMDPRTRIIRANQSIFYNQAGVTNYSPLRRKQVPFRY